MGIEKENKIIFGKKLGMLLHEQDLTQRDLARILGVSAQTVNSYIKGDSYPSIANLLKINENFEVSIDYLLGLSAEPYINIETNLKTEEEILMIRRSYSSMSEKQRKIIVDLIREITKK